MKRTIGMAMVCAALVGCAHRGPAVPEEVEGGGLNVELSSDSPATGCKRLGLVSYSKFKGTFFSCDIPKAQAEMKDRAAELGGNYVKLLSIQDAGVRCQGSGEAYACPVGK